MTRALQRSQREVSRECPTKEVGEESSEDVEKDEGGEYGNDSENGVGFGDLSLLLQFIELRVFRQLCG